MLRNTTTIFKLHCYDPYIFWNKNQNKNKFFRLASTYTSIPSDSFSRTGFFNDTYVTVKDILSNNNFSDKQKQIHIEQYLTGKNLEFVKKKLSDNLVHLSPKASSLLCEKIKELELFFSKFVISEDQVLDIVSNKSSFKNTSTITKKERKKRSKDEINSTSKINTKDVSINKSNGKVNINRDIVGVVYVPDKRSAKDWCKAICTTLTADFLSTAVLSEYINHILVNMNTESENKAALEIYSYFAERLVDYFLYKMYNKLNKGSVNVKGYLDLRRFKTNFKIDSNLHLPSTLSSIGGYLLQSLKVVGLITDKITDFLDVEDNNKVKCKQIIVIPDDVKRVFVKDANKIIIVGLPYKIPVVYKPEKYVQVKNSFIINKSLPLHSAKLGGFLTKDASLHRDLLFDKKWYLEPSIINAKNCIFKLVNGLMSVPYKVNKDVLDFFSQLSVENRNKLFVSKVEFNNKQDNYVKDKEVRQARVEFQKLNRKIRLQENILSRAKKIYIFLLD